MQIPICSIPGPIYLAAPYSDALPSVRQRRAVAANQAAAWLMARTYQGVFSPITHGAAMKDALPPELSHAWWMAQCRPMLRACKSLLVLVDTVSATSASKGVAMEVAWAHKSIPVFGLVAQPDGGYELIGAQELFLMCPTLQPTDNHAATQDPHPLDRVADEHMAACGAKWAEPTPTNTTGQKHDAGKWRYSLIPRGYVEGMCKVLEFGAEKYAPGNWMHVPDGQTRYIDAAMRHIEAHLQGHNADDESGLDPLLHAECCIAFAWWLKTHQQTTQQPAAVAA